jgi:hypothetical protein
MRVVIATALALACSGCVTAGGGPSSAASTEIPADYREQIAQQKSTLFKDPGSVRDAKIAHPEPSMMGWQACIKANAKNSFGGYTGLNMYVVQIYRNGSPPILLPTTIYDGCGSKHYAQFDELNGDYVPPAAPPVPQSKPLRPTGTPKRLSAHST